MIKNLIATSFDKLEFEEERHIYTLQGKNMTPVSKLVANFKEYFDTEKRAKEYALRHGGDPVRIADMWRETGTMAANFGTKTHLFGEKYFEDRSLIPENGHEKAIVSFWNDIPNYIIPLFSELRVYCRSLGYAGTIDNLFYNTRNNTLIISDYKTNKNLYKNFKGKKMNPPFDFLLDMPLNHYQLQLSYYQIPLERIGLSVSERWIVWLLPDGSYNKIEGSDYTKHLRMYHHKK